eukprot:6465965-Amphidinium_carterae.1
MQCLLFLVASGRLDPHSGFSTSYVQQQCNTWKWEGNGIESALAHWSDHVRRIGSVPVCAHTPDLAVLAPSAITGGGAGVPLVGSSSITTSSSSSTSTSSSGTSTLSSTSTSAALWHYVFPTTLGSHPSKEPD